jgi:hypothetical protein
LVVDALSQKYEDEGSLFSLSFIVPDWLQDVCQEWLQDPKSSHLIQQLQCNAPTSPGYSWLHDELRYKGRLYLSKQSKLKSTILSELHATPTTGHSWFTKTYDRVKRYHKRHNIYPVNVYAIIIVLCISIDKSIIRTRSLRNTHSQETQHLSWETL